jgi:thiol:disulfide interchange protein DsbA
MLGQFYIRFGTIVRYCFLTVFVIVFSITGVCVQANYQYVELLDSGLHKENNKIAVVEVFSYSCQHCYQLESAINPWLDNLPEDVMFERIPAMFGGIWDLHGRLFLTLQVIKAEQRVHTAIFEAIRGGNRLTTPEAMADFLEGEGIAKQLFLDTYHSFAVQSKVNDAKQKVQAFGVNGVPTMIIEGKYRFDLRAGGPKGMLKLAERLINQERERK